MHDSKAQDLVLSKCPEKSKYLDELSLVVNARLEELRRELIRMNDDKVTSLILSSEEFNQESRPKIKTTKLQELISKAQKEANNESKKTSHCKQKIATRTIEDPREGITRRFANYIPIKRYQYTQDSLNAFYPNVSDKFHDKLVKEWEVNGGIINFKNLLNDDIILSSYINKFGDDAETIDAYKEFRGLKCDSELILHSPGCSAKVEEGMNEFSIIKTHKELFCRICEVYDCAIHGILDISSFVQPGFPTSGEMKESFDLMIGLSTCLEIRKTLGKWICGGECFMAQTSQEEEEDQVGLNEFTIAKIKLGLQVFKFDPCSVRLYCNEGEVTCHQIFRYFKQEYNERKTFPEYYAKMTSAAPSQKNNKRGKSRKVKKSNFPNTKNLEANLKKNTFGIDCKPCYHNHYDRTCTEEEQSCLSKDCGCLQRGFCDKYCGCDLNKCKIRRKGCDCKSDCMGKKCPCHFMNAECDPDLCKCCFNTEGKHKTNNCQNQEIYFGRGKICKVGPSDVCPGLGLFNVEPIKKGEFICPYIGELISWHESDMRERLNEYDQETYLTTVSDELVIDAKYKGNKARFINHGKSHANIDARYSFSKGMYYFAFFAKEDIAPGSELLFDYEGGGSGLKEQYPWIKNPNPPKIRQPQKEKLRTSKDDHILVPLMTGAKLRTGFKMQFKLNSKPKKFIKVENSRVDDDNEIPEYFAYQEVEFSDEEEIRTPQTITTAQEQLNLNTAIGTFQPEGKQEEIQFPSFGYGSGTFPIPILNIKSEPNLINRGIGMSYENSLFESMMNPVLPIKNSQRATASKKINLRQLEEEKAKANVGAVVVSRGDKEENAINIE